MDFILQLFTNCVSVREDLLVSSSEVTSVMGTTFKQQSHGNITRQHSITHVHFLSGWLPFHRLPLHNWTIGGKVYTIKLNLVMESVVNHSDDQVKIQEEYLIKSMVSNII